MFVEYTWKNKFKIRQQGEVKTQLAATMNVIVARMLEIEREQGRYAEMKRELELWDKEIKDMEVALTHVIDNSEVLLAKRSAYILSATNKQLRDCILCGEYGVDLWREVKETTILVVKILQLVSGNK